MKVLFPGSFDPITKGHYELIKRASNVFEEVVISIMINPNKKTIFTIDERIEFINESIEGLNNIKVVSEEGLTVNACVKHGCNAMLRGVRNSQDIEYEGELAKANKFLNKDIETIIMIADNDQSIISSSFIKEMVINGVDVSDLLPELSKEHIQKSLQKLLLKAN